MYTARLLGRLYTEGRNVNSHSETKPICNLGPLSAYQQNTFLQIFAGLLSDLLFTLPVKPLLQAKACFDRS